jgi:predicted amidohydrolase
MWARGWGGLNVATVALMPDPKPGVSLDRIAHTVKEIKQAHPEVRLILFGETILGWFHKKGETAAYHARIAEPIPGPATAFVGNVAREHDVYISFGMTERGGDKLHNAQVLIEPNSGILAVHQKIVLRSRAFEPGDRLLTTAEVDGTRVAILICADVRSLKLVRAIRKFRPDIVLASLADYATDVRMNRMLGTFFDAWTLVANRFGQEEAITWHGLITITDPVGRIMAHSLGREGHLYAAIPLRRRGFLMRTLRRSHAFASFVGLAVRLTISMIASKLRRSP